MARSAQRSREFTKRAKLYLAIIEGLSDMSDKDLGALKAICDGMGQYNCGWYEYEAAQIINKQIGHIRHHRSQPTGEQHTGSGG